MSVDLVAIADDLSGACEVAAVLGGLDVLVQPGLAVSGSVVVNLATRELPVSAHLAAFRATLAAASDQCLFIKIDSLLRGHVAATVRQLLELRRPVVVCPALPEHGRTVIDGVVHVDGVPLHHTSLWAREPRLAPESIMSLLADMDPMLVASPSSLAGMKSGQVAVCDAVSTRDLTAIADQAVRAGAVLCGASALAAGLRVTRQPPARISHEPRRLCIVAGTASPAARHQVEALMNRNDIDMITFPADPRAAWPRVELAKELTVIGLEPTVRPDPTLGPLLTARLAEVVRTLGDETSCDLALLGGETAQAVLKALGVTRLRVIDAVAPGTVMCESDDRLIATRPGSFGGRDALIELVNAMKHNRQPVRRQDMTDDKLPVIAMTMGDAAGVGPEVSVAAAADAEIRSLCVPMIIGDVARLRRAAQAMKVNADLVTVEGPAQAREVTDAIAVIDLALIPEDLPFGQLSAVAGDAAYQFVKKAADLAVAGEVDAICTAPLNKEALHMGGHNYPGHTEMLAALTGTPEVSMMLTAPRLRVIHVTTHIGLIDAIAKIEPGLVGRVIRRGHEALTRAGIENPRIGVCAINPHAGEGGLFGYGEEETKIVPAVQAAVAEGLDVHGPLPADTAFYLAGRGDYDLMVAMYHDQGHAPLKVLGIETGVNITVGLPVIRTSVDHGTAFDIAGTGTVNPDSMLEAMRQAVQLSRH